jgi:hypothetical protein
MANLRPTFPSSLLDSVKKGPEGPGKPPRLRELSNAISDLLQNDKEVQGLINKADGRLNPPFQPGADLTRALDDPKVQDKILEKTWAKYTELVKRSQP